MDRAAARAAFAKALVLAERADGDDEELRQMRHDCEVTLLVIESGGSALARRRGIAQWRTFAQRRLRRGESLDGLAEMMHSLGIERAPPHVADKLARAWAGERLAALVDDEKRARRATAAARDDEPRAAYRAARAAYARGAWHEVVTQARIVERAHRTATTRESARVLLLAALFRAGKPDLALLRDAIMTSVALAKRGRKVWMFDWRALAALTILCDFDEAAPIHALSDAWRAADPTFAATALLAAPSSGRARSTVARRRKART